jgi:hypothetical protein
MLMCTCTQVGSAHRVASQSQAADSIATRQRLHIIIANAPPTPRRRATTLRSPLPYQQYILTHSPPCSLQQGKRRPWPCAVCSRPALHHHHRDQETDNYTARPTAALQPFRLANAAFISSSSTKPAAPATQTPGLVSGAPGTPPPMKAITGKPHREVPLPSQEGKKGVMQYALYV